MPTGNPALKQAQEPLLCFKSCIEDFRIEITLVGPNVRCARWAAKPSEQGEKAREVQALRCGQSPPQLMLYDFTWHPLKPEGCSGNSPPRAIQAVKCMIYRDRRPHAQEAILRNGPQRSLRKIARLHDVDLPRWVRGHSLKQA